VSDGQGSLAIMAPNSPSFVNSSVPPTIPSDQIEEVTASTPGLHYDPVAKQYIYVWATSKAWAGKAGTLKVQLADGGVHTALFAFTK
jgi:hypothetical protein